MPVSRDKFEAAKKPLDQQIVAFLAKDPSRAYSSVEIYSGINGFESQAAVLLTALMAPNQREAVFSALGRTLADLVAAGKIEVAELQNQQHYAIARAKLEGQ